MFNLRYMHDYRQWIWHLTLSLGLVFQSVAFALVDPTTEALPHIHAIETGLPADALAGSLVRTPQRDTAQQVRRIYPNLTLRWNALTGTPKTLYTLSTLLTQPTQQEVPNVVRDFHSANRSLYGLNIEDLNTLALVRIPHRLVHRRQVKISGIP